MAAESSRSGQSIFIAQAAVETPQALPPVTTADYTQITCFALVGGGDAVLRLEGSLDGVTWINLDPGGDATVSGNEGFSAEILLSFARLVWVSGSAASVAAQWRIR